MVWKVEAYRAENGKVFNTAKEAAVEDIMDVFEDETMGGVDRYTVGLIMDFYPKLEQYFKEAYNQPKDVPEKK